MQNGGAGTASDDVPQPAATLTNMSFLEVERQQRLKRNNEMLKQLGVDKQIEEMNKQKQEQLKELRQKRQETANRRRQEQQAAAAAQPQRASRHEGRARPDYVNKMPLYQVVDKARRVRGGVSKKQSSTGGGGKVCTTSTKYPSWSPITPRAPKEARRAARTAAQDFARDLKSPALVKVMLKSMVSGGYWLSSGTGLAKFLQVASFVTFTCDDTTRPVGAFKHNQAAKGDEQGQRKWDVLLIQSGQGGGFGFSANWRGFAKDQFLHAGDVLVFEVTSKMTLNAHIFRSWDYADPGSKPGDLEEHRFERVTGDLVAAAAVAGDDYSDDFSEDEEDEAALQRPAPASSSRGSSKATERQKSEAAATAAGTAEVKASKSSTNAAAAAAGGKAVNKKVAAVRAKKGGTSKARKVTAVPALSMPAAGERGGSSSKGKAARSKGSGELAGSKRKAAADTNAAADLKDVSNGQLAGQEQPGKPARNGRTAEHAHTAVADGAGNKIELRSHTASAPAATAKETRMQAAAANEKRKVVPSSTTTAAKTHPVQAQLCAQHEPAGAADEAAAGAAPHAAAVAAVGANVNGRLSWLAKLLR